MRLWRGVLVGVAAAATVVIGFALSGLGNGLALLAYVLVVVALLTGWVLGRLRAALPAAPIFRRLLARTDSKETQVEQYESVRRLVLLAGSSRPDLLRLQPLVRDVAAARLSRRYGIDLQRQPERAATLLAGTRVWKLLGPESASFPERDAPGWSNSELERLAEELENLLMEQVPENGLTFGQVASLGNAVLAEVERAVVGKREVLELVLLGLLADGHVLIEDLPGLAKTLIARSFAQATSLTFRRIQFTPDLMPADVTGASIYSQKRGEFEFHPGPVFANLLLADEINRAPAKTQAALLEAMQERQVTIEGDTRRLERPFLVLATQNPIEYEGTYPLPEAQLDRFLLRISVGYPARDDEALVLARRGERRQEAIELEPVVDGPALLAMQRAVERVYVDESVRLYMVDIVRGTRENHRAQVGCSPRGSLALFTLARAHAVLRGRDFVTPEDVKTIAVPALAHRLTLRPELWIQRVPTQDVIREVLDSVPTPPLRDAGPER